MAKTSVSTTVLGFPSLPLKYSNLFGNTGLVIEKQGELTTDLYGLSTCTTLWKCPTTSPQSIPKMFSQHPIYTFVNMERRRVSIESGYFVIAGEYAGVDGGTSASVFELCLGLGEEPIETHPRFNDFAGSPSSPANGAKFVDFETGKLTTDNERGMFDKFSPYVGGSLNEFGGISSYLDMGQAVWRERYVSVFRPGDISFVGHTQYPSGPVPNLGGGQNWLYQGVTYEQRGLCFTISREWRASGRRGWNSDIYGF